MRQKLTRRGFLKLLWNGVIDFALLTVFGVGYSALVEPGLFTVEKIQLKLKRLPKAFSGLSVVQISDIHMGGWMNLDRFQRVADLTKSENPDLLLLTGDFLLGHNYTEASKQALEDLTKVLAPLAKSIPSFAVLGNHDYWSNPEAIRQMLRSCGVTDLTNSVFTLTHAGENLHLCGVDDIWKGDVRLNDVLAQLTDNSVAILLAHEPDFADISAATGKFDLQISGHTHGGQVVIPFFGPPILPYLGQKYPSGLYKIKNMFQYTSRGVGMNTLAVRFNCPPEITLFELQSVD
ncbi:MAG TPA: metallophosphoesterase [Anaerolineales bacterium]|nr:metallophosphoesterase [Anaerolineales bacterium]